MKLSKAVGLLTALALMSTAGCLKDKKTENKLDKTKKELKQAQGENADLTKELAEAKQKIKSLKDNEASVDQMKEDAQAQKAANLEKEAELIARQTEIDETAAQLKEAQTAYQTELAKLAKDKVELANEQNKVNANQKKIDALQAKVNDKEAKLDETATVLSEMNTALESAMGQLAKDQSDHRKAVQNTKEFLADEIDAGELYDAIRENRPVLVYIAYKFDSVQKGKARNLRNRIKGLNKSDVYKKAYTLSPVVINQSANADGRTGTFSVPSTNTRMTDRFLAHMDAQKALDLRNDLKAMIKNADSESAIVEAINQAEVRVKMTVRDNNFNVSDEVFLGSQLVSDVDFSRKDIADAASYAFGDPNWNSSCASGNLSGQCLSDIADSGLLKKGWVTSQKFKRRYSSAEELLKAHFSESIRSLNGVKVTDTLGADRQIDNPLDTRGFWEKLVAGDWGGDKSKVVIPDDLYAVSSVEISFDVVGYKPIKGSFIPASSNVDGNQASRQDLIMQDVDATRIALPVGESRNISSWSESAFRRTGGNALEVAALYRNKIEELQQALID